MPQEVRQIPSKTLSFSANNKVAEQLDRGMVYREIYLRLQGAVTLTAGNNVYANILQGDEWAAARRLRLIANNTEVLKDLPFNALWWLNYFMYGSPPKVTPAVGAGGANPSFDSVLILPLWMPQAAKPMDTALDSRILSSLKLEIEWGQYTNIAAAATGWTTSPTIEAYTLQSFNVSGPFSQWLVYEIEKVITATSSKFTVDLAVGNVYRAFMFNTTDGGVDQGDIINNVKLISGSTTFIDVPDEVLRQVTRVRKGIPRYYSGVAYDDLRQGDANSFDGWYFLDLVTDGFLTEAIDTLGFSEFKLEFNVTVGGGTTKLFVYPLEIVPIRQARA